MIYFHPYFIFTYNRASAPVRFLFSPLSLAFELNFISKFTFVFFLCKQNGPVHYRSILSVIQTGQSLKNNKPARDASPPIIARDFTERTLCQIINCIILFLCQKLIDSNSNSNSET